MERWIRFLVVLAADVPNFEAAIWVVDCDSVGGRRLASQPFFSSSSAESLDAARHRASACQIEWRHCEAESVPLAKCDRARGNPYSDPYPGPNTKRPANVSMSPRMIRDFA